MVVVSSSSVPTTGSNGTTSSSALSSSTATSTKMTTTSVVQLQNRWKRFQKMNWSTPSMTVPHGYAGICSLLCGSYLLYTSQFQSTLDAFGTSLPYQYVFFTILNAIGGYRIAYKAPTKTRIVFKACAIFQCVSCYYVIRFLPTFYTRIPYAALRIMDCAMVLPFLSVGCSFLYAAYLVRKQSPTSAVAIVVGVIASATTFCYPMHLVYDGQWLNCVLEQRYSAEDITLTAYVYLPATMCFSLMIFGATLLQRHIISDGMLGMIGIFCFVGAVFMGLLMPEIQLPEICGLHIYMPCPAPEPGSLSYRIEKATDPRENFQLLLSYPWAQRMVQLLGAVPITDHTSYRPASLHIES